MPTILLVLDQPKRWNWNIEGVEIVSAREYLTNPDWAERRHCKVYHLCRSYRYQSLGYYVGLLAEARGHRPIPRISTVQDIRHPSLLKVVSEDLDQLMQKSLAPLQGNEFEISIYFGRNLAKRYDRLAKQLFNLFPAPLLRAFFRLREGNHWDLMQVSILSTKDIPADHHEFVETAAKEFFFKPPSIQSKRKSPRYNLALLTDPDDPTPPSDEKALQHFIHAGARHSIAVERIGRMDYGRLAEYDALFIRQTTAVNNVTYRFARRAEAEGLVVMDDPTSIVRCTNKVYLAELLQRHRIPGPATMMIHKDNMESALNRLGLPCVLKQPDSAFSLGVVKVDTESEYRRKVLELLEGSDMLIGQEFLRTDFDWRIGVLDRKPLFACKYFMAAGHWQIYNNSAEDKDDYSGDFETMPVELAPRKVVSTALKAANLIGNGLYGVDIKDFHGRPIVIEVNDNPSIDAGVEDKILRHTLYDRIMEVFYQRMERL
jgi:glutathione synthase/RimK-type ligase-like ATP-grasp enzyme